MFRETLFFKTALYSAYDWLAKIRQPIFCRVPSALQLLSAGDFPMAQRSVPPPLNPVIDPARLLR